MTVYILYEACGYWDYDYADGDGQCLSNPYNPWTPIPGIGSTMSEPRHRDLYVNRSYWLSDYIVDELYNADNPTTVWSNTPGTGPTWS